MKLYIDKNVLDAAKDRLRYIFDREENIYVSTSGGKDSTVVMELALQIAKEKNRLPIDVAFLDQESEWQSTINYFHKIKNRPDIRLHWFQVPFRLGSNLSSDFEYLYAWNPSAEDKWIHPKEPDSIHDLGELQEGDDMRFYKVMDLLGAYIFGKEAKHMALIGIREIESVNRRALINKQHRVYDDKPWVSRNATIKGSFRCYPIYDWTLQDVWHFICENKCVYNAAYDKMFQHGKVIRDMRVSSFIHETGISELDILQELEPKTFDKLVARIGGLSAYKHLHKNSGMYNVPKKLPPMFKDWYDYRDYLLEKLCNDESKEIFLKAFKKEWNSPDLEIIKNQIVTILKNDICLTVYNNALSHARNKVRKKEFERRKQNAV